MKNALKVFGMPLLAFMLVVAVVVVVKFGSKDVRQAAAITSPDLKVSNIKWGKTLKGSRCVGGALFNASTSIYKSATVKMALFGPAGTVVSYMSAMNNTGIKPGEVWEFCEEIDSNIQKFTIVEVKGVKN